MNEHDFIEIIVALVFSLPIWVIFIDNWFAKVIGLIWGFFGWYMTITYWNEVKFWREGKQFKSKG